MGKFLLSLLLLSFLIVPVNAQDGEDGWGNLTCNPGVSIGVVGPNTSYVLNGRFITVSVDLQNEQNQYVYSVHFSSPVRVRFVSSTMFGQSFGNPIYGIYGFTGGTLYSSGNAPSTSVIYGNDYGVGELYGVSTSGGSVVYELECLVPDPTPTPTLTPSATPTLTPTPSSVSGGCYPFTSGSLVAGDWALINYDDDLVFVKCRPHVATHGRPMLPETVGQCLPLGAHKSALWISMAGNS